MVTGRVCITKRSPNLYRVTGVNEADRWDESNRSYPGRSHGRGVRQSETRSKACREKSAEAIVPVFFFGKG